MFKFHKNIAKYKVFKKTRYNYNLNLLSENQNLILSNKNPDRKVGTWGIQQPKNNLKKHRTS